MTNQNNEGTIGTKSFALEDRWRLRISEVKGGKWPPPLTSKERGQLKLLANKTGAWTSAVIDYAVKHWALYTVLAAHYGGLEAYPSEPKIGFLLAYPRAALDLLQSIAEN
jgi:hypothetical protein